MLTRRHLLASAAATAATTPLLSAAKGLATKNQPAQLPPNLLLIYLDDAGYGDLSCFGHPTIHTPRLDALADDGARLTQCYSASPACTASRYSLLTGRLPVRSGFGWVLVPNSERGLHPDEVTLATALKSANYRTGIFGKWHLGNKPGLMPFDLGFDTYTGMPYSNDMIPPRWPDIPLYDANEIAEHNPDQTLLTQLFTQRADRFIRDAAAHDDPFFCYVPYSMPHVPLHPGGDFAGTSARGTYGDVIEELDHCIGSLIDTLDDTGKRRDTLVVFASDNGPWIIKGSNGGSAGLLRDGKGSTWEGGVRVPAIASWPGVIEPNRTVHDVCSTTDILPTMLSLTGQARPGDRSIDGTDLTPLLRGDDQPFGDAGRPPLFFYGPRHLHAVRDGAWKYHTRTSSQTGNNDTYFEGRHPLLFNLDVDPSEQYDLVEAQPDRVAAMQTLMDDHEAQADDEGTLWDRNPNPFA